MQNWMLIFCILYLAFSAGCSIPNLEGRDCAEARDAVREFYSLHLAGNMKPSEEYLKLREPFLTDDLKFFVSKNLNSKNDLFTLTDDYPKTFRVGSCEVIESGKKINLQVVLFWKTETRSEQREIYVKLIKENDKWLIDRVENK